MGMNTFEVTTTNFQTQVLDSAEPVLIDFWAEWCTPCRAIAPIVDEIAKEYDGKLRVGKLDTDTHGDVAMRYGIMGIPTLLLFKGGQVAARITGYQPKERILGQIKPHLS
ncbi:MAG: thioredoxin [Anaerolineae bacterium]|nr:thioredoxin [Anaerolineae bacterium]